jgi:hypothetical protein
MRRTLFLSMAIVALLAVPASAGAATFAPI